MTRAWPYVLIGVVVFTAYAWTGQYWLDMVDEGYFLDLAARVQHGQVPYRDFDTYYTPGIFYLFAGIFQIFGANVWPIRLAMAAVRALSIVLLVRLTLRGAPWPFALLPVLTLLALDRWPIEPEPHPAWPALLASLVALEALAAHQGTAQRRWLVVAGAAAAVAFLFKQNTGAFVALGIAGYVVVRHRRALGWRALGFSVLPSVAVTALLWPGMAPFSALALWLPVLAAQVTALLVSQQCDGRKAVLWKVVLTLMPFALLTVAWLIPLAIVLRPYPLPVGLFVGAINQAGLASPWPDLSPGAKVLLQLTVLVVAAASRRWPPLVVAAGVALLIQLTPMAAPSEAALTDDPRLAPLLTWLNDSFGTLHLYLPSAAAWTAVAALALGGRQLGETTPPPWAVLFATLSSLALYPRLDAPHVIVAIPTVLIVATWALARASGARCRGVWSLLAAILVAAVLLAAVAPQAVWRYATLTAPPGNPAGVGYVALDLPRGNVQLPAQTAHAIRSAVQYVEAGTPPGAPFFAYPAVPLFNFLADRPNPTRFDHFFPGALTDEDLGQVVATLEVARPRYVLWDHGGVVYWQTDLANRVLSDYIWRCYGVAATFDLYLVLERQEC